MPRHLVRSPATLHALFASLLLVSVAACAPQAATGGDAGSGPSRPAATTPSLPAGVVEVRSDDGSAVLRLEVASLPAGVGADAIRITALDAPPSERPEVLTPARFYLLEPDGLRLAAPATLTVRLPSAAAAEGLIVLHFSSDGVESLAPSHATLAGDELTLDVELAHFSAIWVGGAPLFRTEGRSPSAESYEVGERVPFEVAYHRSFLSGTMEISVPDFGGVLMGGGDWFRREEWYVVPGTGDVTYAAGSLLASGALGDLREDRRPPAGRERSIITVDGASNCATVGLGTFSHYMTADVPVSVSVPGGWQDMTLDVHLMHSASATCVAAPVDFQALLWTLFPDGVVRTGTAFYEPLRGGGCGSRSYTSPVRIARDGETFVVVQIHGRGLEQRSEGIAGGGLVVTMDRVPTHDEMYFLHVDPDRPNWLLGRNFNGPQGSIASTRDFGAFFETLTDDVLQRIAAGESERVAAMLGLSDRACETAVEVRLD